MTLHVCDMRLSHVWHDSFRCMTWPSIYMLARLGRAEKTHWYVWHESFIGGTWLIQMCAMTHLYVWHNGHLYTRETGPLRIDTFICVTWSIHMCDMTHSCVWHGHLYTRETGSLNVRWCAYRYVCGCAYRHVCVHIYVLSVCIHTGWRRLIGSPKLQIIFHERATKYRSLLRKMTSKDKGSYESSPPCIAQSIYSRGWVAQKRPKTASWLRCSASKCAIRQM